MCNTINGALLLWYRNIICTNTEKKYRNCKIHVASSVLSCVANIYRGVGEGGAVAPPLLKACPQTPLEGGTPPS